MKLFESIALALGIFVLAGIATGMLSPYFTTRAVGGLLFWIGAQVILTALLLWAIPRRPITYDDAVRHDTSDKMEAAS